MALDTNIALGVKPIEQPNMLAQMGQMMQIRQAQQGYESENALRDFYAQGGDLSTAEGKRQLMSKVGLKGMDIIGKQSEIRARDVGTLGKEYENARVGLTNVNDEAGYYNWVQSGFNNPAIASHLIQMGITPEKALANARATVAKEGLSTAIAKSSMGISEFIKQDLGLKNATKNAQISAAAPLQQAQLAREKWNYDLENPAMQPLAGEKVLPDGTRVPAYYGYDPRSNTMVEVSMPTVTVGRPTTISTNNYAPPNVNALTMPPAGAPTSPVARPATAAIPSAAAPSAAIPSAASPTSVVPGAPNAPAPVRFGPKSTAENLTEAQGKATGFALRAKEASDILDVVGKDGKVQPGVLKRVGESVPLVGEGLGTLLNVTQTPQQQQVEQAQRNFLNAILRQESGAAINQSEFDNGKKQYFPQPGDSKEVIEQKRLNRENVVKSLQVAAGPGMKQVAPSAGVKVGTVEDGYRFKGGDPANKNNWEKQ